MKDQSKNQTVGGDQEDIYEHHLVVNALTIEKQEKVRKRRSKRFVKIKSQLSMDQLKKLKFKIEFKQMDEDLKPPDIEKAKNYGRSRGFSKRKEGTEEWESIKFGCNLKEYARFGAGVQLYFQFLKNFAILFFCMFLVSCVSIYVNYSQDGYDKWEGSAISKMSLGNMEVPPGKECEYYWEYSKLSSAQISALLPDQQLSAQELSDFSVSCTKAAVSSQFEDWKSDQQLTKYVPVLIDFIVMVMFYGYFVYWRIKTTKIAKDIEQEQITVSDYTIYVTGLPKQGFFDVDLKKFFDRQLNSKVISCHLVRDYDGHLRDFIKLSDLYYLEKYQRIQIEQQKAKKNKYTAKREKKEKQLAGSFKSFFQKNKIKSYTDFPVIGAFVTLNSLEDKVRIFNLYQQYNEKSYLKRILCCKKSKTMLQKHIFQDCKLKIEDAIEPINIKWENYDIKWVEELIRKVYLILIMVVIILCAAICLTIPAALSKQGNPKCSVYNTLFENVNFNSVSEAQLTTWENSLASYDYDESELAKECICKQISLLNIALDKTSGLKDFCGNFFSSKIKNFAMQVCCGLVTLIVNAVMKGLIWKLAQSQRKKTSQDENKYMLITAYFCLVFNNLLVPMFVLVFITIRTIDFIPAKIVTSYFPYVDQVVKQDSIYYSSDFNKQFYADVGGKYFGFFCLQIFIPQIFLVFFPCIWIKIRDWRLKRALTHKEAKKVCTAPVFKLPIRYAEALALITTAFILSAGMPILLLLGGCCLVTRFFTDKYTTLKLQTRPSFVDSSLNQLTLDLIPDFILKKIFITILMLTTPSIFPMHYMDQFQDGFFDSKTVCYGDYENFDNLALSSTSEDNYCTGIYAYFKMRLFHYNSYLHVILLCFIAIVWMFEYILIKILKKFCIDLFKGDKNTMSLHLYKKDQGTYEQEKDKIKTSGLQTYDIMKNEDYKDMVVAIKEFTHVQAEQQIKN